MKLLNNSCEEALMKDNKSKILKELVERIPALSSCEEDISKAFNILKECFENGGKLLVAGNGGSCADSEHIAGELMKGFYNKRPLNSKLVGIMSSIDKKLADELSSKLQEGLPTIALSNHNGLNTAFANDIENGGQFVFAQQTNVYGKPNDVLLAISTSGNSKNLVFACVVAKAKGMKIIELTGANGGEIKRFADVAIKAPSEKTHLIQEYHLPIYHALCLMLEEHFYK